MDRAWVEARKSEYLKEADAICAALEEKINSAPAFTEKDREALLRTLDKDRSDGCYCNISLAKLEVMVDHEGDSDLLMLLRELDAINTKEYGLILSRVQRMETYLDSEPMEFDGDIIITDPCYIMRAEHHGTSPLTDDDWKACNYGAHMDVLGIHNYMTRDTLYGDWGCTVYDTDSHEPLGSFCADAGLVSVFLLEEVLAYNPDFEDHEKGSGLATWVPDFKGTVQFVVERETGVYEETTEFWKAGNEYEDFTVHVVGHGVNKKTGKPINFRSTQSSL